MTLFNRLKRAASVNLIRYACQLIIGIVIARTLSVEDKGVHFVFTTISAASAILCSFGLANAVVYYLKKAYISSAEARSYILFSTAVVFFVFALVMIVFAGYFEAQLTTEVDSVFIMVLFFIYTVFCFLNYFVNSYCLAFNRMSLYLYCFAGSSALSMLLIFFGCYFYHFNLKDCLLIIVLLESISSLLAFVYAFWYLEVPIQPKEGSSGVGLKEIVSYASKNYLGVSGNTITSRGDSFVLSLLLPQDQIGLYSVAKSIYRLLAIVPQTINSVLFGVLCELEKEQSQKLVTDISIKLFFAFSFLLLLSFYWLDGFITLIWGDLYSSIYFEAFVLCVASLLAACSAPINPYFLAAGKPLITSKIVLVSGFIGLAACYQLTAIYGVLGASLSVLISSSITFLLRGLAFRNHIKVSH